LVFLSYFCLKDVEYPHLLLLCPSFYDQISIKLKNKFPVSILKKDYVLLYQPKGSGKFEGVNVNIRDSFSSLNLFNGLLNLLCFYVSIFKADLSYLFVSQFLKWKMKVKI
jgi:hypothetical protein